MRTIVVLLAIVLGALAARAETYYLDAAAAGPIFDGSQARPWKSVEQMQQFLNALPDRGSGDTVLVAAGSYGDYIDGALASQGFSTLQNQVLSRTDWLTIKARDPAHKPVFRHIQVYGVRDAYLKLDGLHVLSTVPHAYDNCILVRYGVRQVRLLNLEVSAEDDQLALPEGIVITYTNPSNILVEGCEIHHTDTGINPEGTNITIRNNHIHHIATSAIKSGGGTNMLVEGNHIHDQVVRIVRLNLYGPITGTFVKGEAITQETTGAKATVYVVYADRLEVTPANKVVIEFQNGLGVRSDTGAGAVGPLTNVNFADRSHGSGLSVRTNGYTARGNHIHNYGSSAGIFVYPVGTAYSNMLFENNLVYAAISRAVVFNDIGDNFVVRNNTFVGGVDAYFFTGYDGSGLHFHNNLARAFTVDNAAPLAKVHEGRNILQYIVVRNPYSTNGSFPAGSSSVRLGTGSTGDAAFDALFVAAATADFRLAAGSQAVGFADPAQAPTVDFNGFPRDAAPDAGCFELGTQPPSLSWEVVGVHGPAGQVASAATDGYVDPRRGGPQAFRVTSSAAIDPATVTAGLVTISGAVAGDLSSLVGGVALEPGGRVLIISLNGPLPDGESCAVAVGEALRTAGGRALAGDRDLSLVARAGDVNADGQVTVADLLAVRAAVGQPLSGQTARYDVDRSGSVTVADMLSVRRGLPAAR